jgi:hypothetical protein
MSHHRIHQAVVVGVVLGLFVGCFALARLL